MTIPGPPPYGVSSIVRRRSLVKSRRSWAVRLTNPFSRAAPTRASAKKRSISSGKIVRTSMRDSTGESYSWGTARAPGCVCGIAHLPSGPSGSRSGADSTREAPVVRSRLRTLSFAAVAAVGGLVVVAMVGEGLARVAGYRPPGLYDADGRYVEIRETTALHGPYPPLHGRLYHVDFDVEWITNRDGFREHEPAPKAPGEWRIGLFGDSFVAGYGVKVSERLGDLWFEDVRSRMPGVTLLNFGASNAGCQQLADFLLGRGRDYALDEIILGFYSGNEAGDNIRWEKARAAQAANGGSTGRRHRFSARRWLLRHSALAKLLWMNWLGRIVHRFDRVDAPTLAKLDNEWPEIERGLDRFREAVGTRPFTLWYLPPRPEWDDEHWAFMKRQQHLSDDRDRFLLRDRTAAWARSHGVAFVDMTPALLHQPAAAIRFEHDGHYTAEGHRRMAEEVVRHGGSAARLRD